MDRVRINKKDYPVRFGWNALAEFENLSGSSVIEFASMQKLSAGNTIKLVYVGLLYGAKKDNQDIDFTIEDVGDWLDKDSEIITKGVVIFVKSIPEPGKKK